jgi:hypothetical protein
MTKAQRTAIGKVLCEASKKYWEGLSAPLEVIGQALTAQGFDASVLDGIYCGESGRESQPVDGKTHLVFSWYRMASGRYEVTAYLS